jgi:translocation and assembly module TamB
MGESAIVGQALADPVANRLQRVFGITQLNIAPTFANNSALPTAQFSVQQQVTSRITLTYTTAVEEAGQTAVSGQFFLTRQWSAMAMRDQFGLFTFKLTYKKQFQ